MKTTVTKLALAVGAAALLVGCAQVPPGAGSDPTDPWEKVNRQTYAFNTTVDTYLIRPVAKGYTFLVPDKARESIAVAKEDFGQTLGVWGVPAGPYFVLPFLGPSSVRDTAGLAGDYGTYPLTYLDNEWVSWGLYGAYAINTRANLIPATDLLAKSIDPYAMARGAYLSMRRNAVYDGNPPLDDDDWDADDDSAAATNAQKDK